MDIVTMITAALRESATAAVAIFAIWSLNRSYQIRDTERKVASEARIHERESYAARLVTVNQVLTEKLDDFNQTLGANTEVLRQLLAEREK